MADFDFSVAMTIAEYFESKDVEARKWRVKTCHSDNGGEFPALQLRIGTNEETGRALVSMFALCKQLQKANVGLTPEWVDANKSNIRLIDAEDVNTSDGHDAKFGIIYLDTGGVDEWDEWE